MTPTKFWVHSAALQNGFSPLGFLHMGFNLQIMHIMPHITSIPLLLPWLPEPWWFPDLQLKVPKVLSLLGKWDSVLWDHFLDLFWGFLNWHHKSLPLEPDFFSRSDRLRIPCGLNAKGQIMITEQLCFMWHWQTPVYQKFTESLSDPSLKKLLLLSSFPVGARPFYSAFHSKWLQDR